MPSASSCSPAFVPCRAAGRLALMAALAHATLAFEAHAQAPAAPFGTAQQTWTIGAAPPPVSYSVAPSTAASASASDLEVASLYALAAGYGVGTGIWLDAELSIDDPGLQF